MKLHYFVMMIEDGKLVPAELVTGPIYDREYVFIEGASYEYKGDALAAISRALKIGPDKEYFIIEGYTK